MIEESFVIYSELADDETLLLLDPTDRWHFIALLCCKSQGILDDQGPLLLEKVAVRLRVDLDDLEALIWRLDRVGLIDIGTLQPNELRGYAWQYSDGGQHA